MPPEDSDHGDLERDLGKLPGVRAARIVADRSRIKEVHVVSDGSKGPKQLIRDIETLARASYDLEIDHRVISVTEFPDDDTSSTHFVTYELGPLTVTTDRQQTTCTVEVRRGDLIGQHTTTGIGTTSALPRLIGEATLGAITDLTGTAVATQLANCLVVPVGEHNVAVAVLLAVDDDGHERVIAGVHPVRRDANEALARAVVDAVVRFGV